MTNMKKMILAALAVSLVGAFAAEQAMACPGVIATMVGNCHLDEINNQIKQAVPVWNQIDQQATIVGRQIGQMVVGAVCQSLDGQYAGQLGNFVPVGETCQLVLETGATVLGQVVQ